MRKKTHEEFVKELKQLNPNIVVLGKYDGATTKIKCRCLIDSYEWETTPHNLLKGKGCPKCGIKSRIQKRKLSQDEFNKRVQLKSPNIQVLNQYVNNHSSLQCKCQICEYEWKSTASSLLNGTSCPKCNGHIQRTLEEFIDEMYTINSNIEIIGNFINVNSKIKCHCLIDDYVWCARPSKLLSGQGCPICGKKKCADSKTLSHQEFVAKLHNVNPNIVVLSNYEKSKKAISVECSIDHYKWNATPNALLSGRSGCKLCANRKQRMSHKNFVNRLSIISPNIKITGEYFNSKTPINYQCLDCGLNHKATPSNLLKGYGCPICKKSKGEKKCLKYFQDNNIIFTPQYQYSDLYGVNNYPLRFDFAILGINHNVLGLIEYDGIFHFEKQYDNDGYENLQIHDQRKNIYCEEHNIPLLRIPYWEYDNVDEILDEFIKNISQPDCEGKNISC